MFRRTAYVLTLLAPLLLAACDTTAPTDAFQPPPSAPPGSNVTDPVALIDLVGSTYFGFEGGLYRTGNAMPPAHADEGREARRMVQPLDADGNPDPDGKIVLLAVGMSNVTQEWCQSGPGPSFEVETSCNPWTFMGQATTDPAVDREHLVIVNGARGGQANAEWDMPSDFDYTRIAEEVLPYFGVTEAQVQIVWTKAALKRSFFGSPDAFSRPFLPNPNADAFQNEEVLGDVMRALRARYPNLEQVFLSSRIYAGYAASTSNSPEPYAYETGFAARWLIDAQIEQHMTGRVDSEAGDLGPSEAAWVAWGPYLWAPGDEPRSDGLQWTPDLYPANDGIHPNTAGETLVANALLAFFKTSEFTSCWFLNGPGCQ